MTQPNSTLTNGLIEFLDSATSPFHAVAAMASILLKNGFEQLAETQPWQLSPGGRYFVTRNDSAIIAFIYGKSSSPQAGLRMVGAHTDSPCLMAKPVPERHRQGYFQVAVEVYGGALLNPWFDRDLSLAGRVSYEDQTGAIASALIDFRRAIAMIPSLAIHLDRDANKNRSINPQTDILPILCQLDTDQTGDFRAVLQQQLLLQQPQARPRRIHDYELCFYPLAGAARVGLQQEFLGSARLDNLLSCFVGLQALVASDNEVSSLLVCNDHEEVGSMSAAGAQGPMLQSVLQRLCPGAEQYAIAVANSMLISADNAHGIHPNFADKHDENHGPRLNAGPVIKVNANQRYASNSETAALFRTVCERQGVPLQSFVVRSDMACGSTIGPITAGTVGVRTLDIGVPTFAMHSCREWAGVADVDYLFRAFKGFYQWQQALPGSASR